ncbi:MAG: WbqC family protein [Cyanobacteria bacterium TGS_CYA1]|nr:WbqC family protein [Cyanobacteria bacterium TGS_CYA1]
MAKLVSISQPAYLPWLGYFARIAESDLHIVLDHVQLEKRSFTVRNRIRTANGWNWLTVPVKTKGKGFDLPINRIEIQNEKNWRNEHYQSIKHAYAKTRFFNEHKQFFESFYHQDWQMLFDLCREQTSYLLKAFEINTPIISSTQLNSNFFKDDLILDLCKKVECSTYISGPFGRDYICEKKFEDAGIKVIYHDYSHPVYKQRWEPFEPYMSAIDLLFNHGPVSKRILTGKVEDGESMNADKD